MNVYPICLNLKNKNVLVVGAGSVAARKVEVLLSCDACVTLVAPDAEAIPEKTFSKKIKRLSRSFEEADLDAMFMVIAATDDASLNKRIAKSCAEKGLLCNIVDQPKLCNFITPGVIRRGDLLIAFSSSGAAPFFTRFLRKKFEKDFSPFYTPYLQLLKKARKKILKKKRGSHYDELLFSQLCRDEMLELVREGKMEAVEEAIECVLEGLLFGKKILVTRSARQAPLLMTPLKDLGAKVISYPCIEPKLCSDAEQKIKTHHPFEKYSDFIFTSENSVFFFFELLSKKNLSPSVLHEKRIHVVGPGTKEALEKKGLSVFGIPRQFHVQGLLNSLEADLSERRFFFPKAVGARKELSQKIRKRGGKIEDFLLYESEKPSPFFPWKQKQNQKQKHEKNEKIDAICFTSPSCVTHYVEQNPDSKDETLFVIGKTTEKSARQQGFKKIHVAKKATIPHLIEKMVEVLV